MANEIVTGILGLVLIVGGALSIFSVWNFIIETPKQLKRIADALERKKEDGK